MTTLDISPKGYPVPSLQRLPLYLRQLKLYAREGREMVSCTQIADDLGLISVQVRKDLSMTGISGRPKVGYSVESLISTIESFLGWDKERKAVLAGAGSLGSAILGYPGFVEHGLHIAAAFDVDLSKVGRSIRGRMVHPLSELTEYIQKNQILIGIITVPQAGAQAVTDIMIAAGVRAIWNYSPAQLVIPAHVVCETVKLSSTFAVLSSRLKDMLDAEAVQTQQNDEPAGSSAVPLAGTGLSITSQVNSTGIQTANSTADREVEPTVERVANPEAGSEANRAAEAPDSDS